MKRYSWKYIAGLIDGEGCLDVQVTKINGTDYIRPRVRITLVEPSKFVLANLQQNFGGGLYKRNHNTTNSHWQNAWSWELNGYPNVCSFLRNFVNHLLIKKEQARLILWMESNLKNTQINNDTRQCVRNELSAMKLDPQRLSERAQETILRCDSPSTN